MTLLEREASDGDREAEREAPRPGVWAGEDGADLRALTQDQTDALIRWELWQTAPAAERDDIARAVGPRPLVGFDFQPGVTWHAARQRGGIDSDPLVRILAHRAWGDRDRQWFALRGVRKGERIVGGPILPISLARGREMYDGTVLADGRPGDRVAVDYGPIGTALVTVGDRPRE